MDFLNKVVELDWISYKHSKYDWTMYAHDELGMAYASDIAEGKSKADFIDCCRTFLNCNKDKAEWLISEIERCNACRA